MPIVPPIAIVAMSTREIATVCGKEHRNVVADLRRIAEQCEIDVLGFQRIYTDSMNRQQTEYLLDKETTFLLMSGYSAPMRQRIIKRWMELEQGTTPKTFVEALRLALNQQIEIERQQAQIEAERPYAEIGHVVTDREAIILREWIALLKSEGLKIKETEVTEHLIDCRYLYRDPNRRLRAYAAYDHLFTYKYGRCADGQMREFVHITGAGVKELYPLVKDFADRKKSN
jgi:phage regulator Rha-like protein